MPALRRQVLETVLCFVRDPARRYLFLVRGKKPGDVHAGKYNAPGGKLEPGESPLEAMRREVREETGLAVTAYRRLGFLAFPGFHHDANGLPIDESMHVYVVTGWTGAPLATSDEGDLVWIPEADVLDLPLWEGDKRFLPLVFADRRFEGKLVYQEGRLVTCDLEAEPGSAA